MQSSYSVASARARLAEILDEVEAGEDVELVRRGKKVAMLISPARYSRLSGKSLAFGEAYDSFMRRRAPETFGLDPGSFEASRDRAPGRPVKL